MKVFVTKYALTQGILEIDVEETDTPTMVKSIGRWPQYFHGNDWHKTRERAVWKANDMRLRKIATLNKKLEKLETPFK